MSHELPARFTIQRISSPASRCRYLAITNDGKKGWSDGLAATLVFDEEAAADDFHRYRMGDHTDDAFVVRHTIH